MRDKPKWKKVETEDKVRATHVALCLLRGWATIYTEGGRSAEFSAQTGLGNVCVYQTFN